MCYRGFPRGMLRRKAVWWSGSGTVTDSTVISPPKRLAIVRAMYSPRPELGFSSRLATSGVHPRSKICWTYWAAIPGPSSHTLTKKWVGFFDILTSTRAVANRTPLSTRLVTMCSIAELSEWTIPNSGGSDHQLPPSGRQPAMNTARRYSARSPKAQPPEAAASNPAPPAPPAPGYWTA